MNTAARASLYFVGTALLVAAAVLIGERWEAGEPLDPLVPCVLGAFGIGLFGFGLFSSVPLVDDCNASSDGGVINVDYGDGGSD